jgi:hypothetical protein
LLAFASLEVKSEILYKLDSRKGLLSQETFTRTL